MKKLIVLVLLLVASPALAAPLTNDQATSLIRVVQSSSDTPASAFVNLITVFSNITDTQAESLIGVVQASPGTPADSFVNLLTSFTIDYVATPAATSALDTLNQQITNLNSKLDESNTKLGSIMENTRPSAPVAPIHVAIIDMNIETIPYPANEELPLGRWYFNVQVTSDGKPLLTPITVQWPSDHDWPVGVNGGTSLYSGGSEDLVKTATKDTIQFGPYLPTTTGTKTIVFTASGITKNVSVIVK